MESAPVLDALEMDVRSVAVIWADGEPHPDVTWSGCSPYEAVGFLYFAIDKLKHEYRFPREDDDDDDDLYS